MEIIRIICYVLTVIFSFCLYNDILRQLNIRTRLSTDIMYTVLLLLPGFTNFIGAATLIVWSVLDDKNKQ